MAHEATAATPLLAVDKLSVFYDAFQAVHDVDLTIRAGEIVSIIGANGAGKSSFLKALATMTRVEKAARSSQSNSAEPVTRPA